METIKYKLSKKKKEFLQNMQEYLDTKLYFYGSVQRLDYIDNVSDIDVCIFTDNMDSTILSLQQYLNVERKYIKKFYINSLDKKIMSGYKIYYRNSFIKLEISIYDEKYKEDVLYQLTTLINMPYYYTILLLILKYVNIVIPIPYRSLKNNLLNFYKRESNTYFFITLENK